MENLGGNMVKVQSIIDINYKNYTKIKDLQYIIYQLIKWKLISHLVNQKKKMIYLNI